jgi:hypothetical protein
METSKSIFTVIASNIYVGEPTTPLDAFESFDEAMASALHYAKVYATYSTIPEEWRQRDEQAIRSELLNQRHARVAFSPNNPTKQITIMRFELMH